MKKPLKRFIAGAVCPRCGEMDKLFTSQVGSKAFRECVSCDFKEEMRFKPQSRELDTRVNVSRETKQAETQVLILDPSGNNKKSE